MNAIDLDFTGCTRCPLHADAVCPGIGGRGPMTARVLVVGQNPGATENVQGEAFIGKSGKLLMRMLRAAGFDPDRDVRITNAVKCHTKWPDGKPNRPPYPSEVDACRPNLYEEIHAQRPEAIIALGDVALRALTKLSGLGNRRGREEDLHPSFNYDGAKVIATWHPAFVARKQMAENIVVTDFRRVRDRGLPSEQIEWEWWDGSPFPHDRRVSYDIETDFIHATKQGGSNVIQGAASWRRDDGTIRTVVTHDVAAYAQACAEVVHARQRLVGHNSWLFDAPRLRRVRGKFPLGEDTLVLAYLLDETQPKGLEALAVRYLGVRGWKEEREAEHFTEAFAVYNARDTIMTLRLDELFYDQLDEQQRNIIRYILKPSRQALDACTERGIAIDGEEVERARVVQEAEIAAHLTVLQRLAKDDTEVPSWFVPPLDEKARKKYDRMVAKILDGKHNPRSTEEVALVLQWRGFYLPQTKTGKDSVAKGVIKSLAGDPYCDALLDFRVASTELSSFIRPYAKIAATGDGRAHAEFTQTTTETGRTSARKSKDERFADRSRNVQNLKRELKSFFRVLVQADYSAIEFREAADEAGASEVIERYRADPNFDPHKWFASLFYNVTEAEVDKHRRQIAKSANFSQLYLGKGYTLVEYAGKQGVKLAIDEGDALHQAWHRALPEFFPWYMRVWDELVATGCSRSRTGQVRHFGNVREMHPIQRAETLRQAVNHKVQSLSAHIALLGLAECRRVGLPINGFFHDAVSFDFPWTPQGRRDGLAAVETIATALTAYPPRILHEHFGVELRIPLQVEIKVAALTKEEKPDVYVLGRGLAAT